MCRYFVDPSQRLELLCAEPIPWRTGIDYRAGNVYLFLCWEWSNDHYRFVERNVDITGLVLV